MPRKLIRGKGHNAPPVANVPPATNNVTASGDEDTTIGVVMTGSDPDGSVASFIIVTLPANGVLKTLADVTLMAGNAVAASSNQAQVNFFPDADWNGVTSFTFRARDNTGEDDATPGTATITVVAVPDVIPNVRPVATDVVASGNEDTAITVNLAATDSDGTIASFIIGSLPANGTLKTVGGATLSVSSVVAAAGNAAQVVFHPTADWNGETSFTYTARDNFGEDDLTAATATITVNPVPETGAGDMNVTLRTQAKKEVDLTSVLANFDDIGNEIEVSVSNPSGNLLARIWNMRDLVGSDDWSFVKRELLDYFQIHAIDAAVGDYIEVSFTGWTGPNGTGSQETYTLVATCDNSPVTEVTWSTLLRAQFGGWPIHKHLPGNQADWVLSNDNGGQFSVMRDATARSCLGSGRSYPNGIARVVLAPKLVSPNGMDLNSANSTYGNQLASAPYGGLAQVAPVDGVTTSFTLTNAVLGMSVTVNVLGSATAPIHVGAWPLIDSLTITGRPPWQLNWYSRLGNTSYYRYGRVFELQDDLDHTYSASGNFSPGFTFAGGSTTIGGTAPTSLFSNGGFSGRQYPLDGSLPVYNPNLITIQGESPDTYLPALVFASTGTNSASTTMGWHVKKMQAKNLVISYSRNIACASNILYHDPTNIDAGITLAVRPSTGGGTISCWIKGALGFSGTDSQVVGNVFETPHTLLDQSAFGTSIAQSNQNELVALYAFNAWIGCRGQDVITHKDGFQWTGGSSPPGGPFLGTEEAPDRTNAGYYTAHVVIGNIWYPSGRRGQRVAASGAHTGLKQSPWAEVFFSIPMNPNGLLRWVFAYNFLVSSVSNGVWLHNPTGKTRIHHNMLLRWRATGQAWNSSPGFTIRTHDEHQYQGVFPNEVWVPGCFEDGVDDADYMFLYNICQGGYSADLATNVGSLGTNPGAGGGTYDNAAQDATLVNPLILDAVQDVSDIIPAYRNQDGLTPSNITEANCFEHLDVIDHRRRFADLTAIANYSA